MARILERRTLGLPCLTKVDDNLGFSDKESYWYGKLDDDASIGLETSASAVDVVYHMPYCSLLEYVPILLKLEMMGRMPLSGVII